MEEHVKDLEQWHRRFMEEWDRGDRSDGVRMWLDTLNVILAPYRPEPKRVIYFDLYTTFTY